MIYVSFRVKNDSLDAFLEILDREGRGDEVARESTYEFSMAFPDEASDLECEDDIRQFMSSMDFYENTDYVFI